MYYGNIKKIDIANGEGVRVSLFVSGCRNCCKNCFNPETWNFKYGQEFNLDTENEILNLLEQKHIKGLTVLGGEPFEPENQKELLPFIKKVKHKFPHKDLWFFTGYIYDQDLVPNGKKYCEVTDELLSYIDVLVDGPFIEEEKDISLKFRGSKNQRIIYLKNK
ncbi:MAG: anaerobic ribonucleoside-triphosphate reductase activating protein [Fusobacterium sp. JB021]|nr:anaerobic ribonucleoside-triphosphate reductase activating protein [Fusobacterium sp. JB021]